MNVSVREKRALESFFFMWQSLPFEHHYHYYPKVTSIPNCRFENILAPNFCINIP